MDGIEVVEVPALGSVRKHLAAARTHLEVCKFKGADMPKKHQENIAMALRWIVQLEQRLDDEAFFGRSQMARAYLSRESAAPRMMLDE